MEGFTQKKDDCLSNGALKAGGLFFILVLNHYIIEMKNQVLQKNLDIIIHNNTLIGVMKIK
jgi:hypothetical protein